MTRCMPVVGSILPAEIRMHATGLEPRFFAEFGIGHDHAWMHIHTRSDSHMSLARRICKVGRAVRSVSCLAGGQGVKGEAAAVESEAEAPHSCVRDSLARHSAKLQKRIMLEKLAVWHAERSTQVRFRSACFSVSCCASTGNFRKSEKTATEQWHA